MGIRPTGSLKAFAVKKGDLQTLRRRSGGQDLSKERGLCRLRIVYQGYLAALFGKQQFLLDF